MPKYLKLQAGFMLTNNSYIYFNNSIFSKLILNENPFPFTVSIFRFCCPFFI